MSRRGITDDSMNSVVWSLHNAACRWPNACEMHRAIAHSNSARIIADPPLALDAITHQQSTVTQGDGTAGPLGVKKTTSWLNERGYRTRLGARFGVATIHGILTNAIYIGDPVFNKRDLRTSS